MVLALPAIHDQTFLVLWMNLRFHWHCKREMREWHERRDRGKERDERMDRKMKLKDKMKNWKRKRIINKRNNCTWQRKRKRKEGRGERERLCSCNYTKCTPTPSLSHVFTPSYTLKHRWSYQKSYPFLSSTCPKLIRWEALSGHLIKEWERVQVRPLTHLTPFNPRPTFSPPSVAGCWSWEDGDADGWRS